MTDNKKIICITDFFRGSEGFLEIFLHLIREPIRQGTGFDIGNPVGGKISKGSNIDFNKSTFFSLAGIDENLLENKEYRRSAWKEKYFSMPQAAVDYLFKQVTPDHIVLAYEVAPWFAKACSERNIKLIELRLSPLRFGRDLYAALRCDNETIFKRIASFSICEEELRLEASILSTNVRMHKMRLEGERNFTFENLNNSLVFLGQAPYDASLLTPSGKSLRCTDFTEELKALSKDRQIIYKSHPYASEYAKAEIKFLEKITGKKPIISYQNAYQIISSEDDLVLTGISSGMLQEASWFDKPTHILHQPFTPLTFSDTLTADSFQQVHFQTLISPEFWHQILAPEQPTPRLAKLPNIPQNHAREIIDQWWDYSKVITWERSLPYESFMRGGGAGLRQRIEKLEQISDENYINGHDFRLNSGERQIATRYEDIRADHRFRYEWINARLPEGGVGLDSFCGNGYGTWLLSQTRQVWGIDGSAEAIKLAEQHYKTPNAVFSQAFYPFELPKENYDFVVSLESIEHVEDGAGFFKCLVESLKPGGLLFFSTPCEEFLPHTQFSDSFHFHFKHYTYEETVKLALDHNLEIIEWASQNVYSLLPDGELSVLNDNDSMKLRDESIGQFLIFCCRKKIT